MNGSASGKRESGQQHWFNNVAMLHNMTIRRASFKTGVAILPSHVVLGKRQKWGKEPCVKSLCPYYS